MNQAKDFALLMLKVAAAYAAIAAFQKHIYKPPVISGYLPGGGA